MSRPDVILPIEAVHELPEVRAITFADLGKALRLGFEDFRAMPTHVVFLAVIYPVVGLLLATATFGYDLVPLLFPLASGFALIGPLAAIGLYELSRRREAGLDTSWRHAFDVRHSPSFRSIVVLGLALCGLFALWIAVAGALFAAYFGPHETMTIGNLVRDVFSTSEGRALALTGNLVGLAFALVAFSMTVVTFPLLLDRHVGLAAAVSTSLRAVAKNPLVLAAWGLIVATGLVLGMLPLFVGLAVVLPVLGHASWHLYRLLVVPDHRARPQFHATPKPKRYAADFPASLFTHTKPEE